MDNATKTLIAVPQALADQARTAARQWDPEGADSMFRNPTLHRAGDEASRLVYAYGWISDVHLPAIQAAAVYFPGGQVVTADAFETALAQAGLERVTVTLPR